MMNRQTSIFPLRLQRFAWMVALVVVLRVFAWDLHHAFDLHAEVGETCQVCLVMERGGDGVTPTTCEPGVAPCGQAPRHQAAGPILVATLPCPLPRGPPSSFS